MSLARDPAGRHRTALADEPVVFVSYCHEDAEWRQRFEVMLKPEVRRRGLQLWSDGLIVPSRRWRDEIEDAIARADVALLLVSPDFLASEFIMEQELPALIRGRVRLVPVLVRSCRYDAVDALARVQWAHDPGRDGPVMHAADVDGAIVRVTDALMAVVDEVGRAVAEPHTPRGSGPPMSVAVPALSADAKPGRLDAVPEPPLGFVQRDELDGLRAALTRASQGAVGITGGRAFGLHGQGGIGKTVLAAALARDELLRGCFPDGVFWVTAGQQPDLAGAQIDLLRRLGAPADGVRTTLDGVVALRAVLADRRCLLVVDDVWQAAAAEAFDVTGSAGRVLYTTRDPATLRYARAGVHHIDVLPANAARQLLAQLTETPVDELPAVVERILEATGRVALALALVGAAVGRGSRDWHEIAAELEQAAGTFLAHPYANVFKAMGVAVAALEPELAEAHKTLTVYPEDERVPITAVARLWAHLFELTAAQTHAQLQALATRELITLEADTISLHDLQRDFLLLRATSVRLLHHELLTAYRALLPLPSAPWRALPEDEPYIYDHLVEHLIAAGDMIGAAAIATDLALLAARAFAVGPHAAQSDVRRVAAAAPDDATVAWVLGRITQWGHLLNGHDVLRDLAATLWTRVSDAPPGVDKEPLRNLLGPYALTPRGGLPNDDSALLRVLEGHHGRVSAVAYSPSGDILATAARDGTVQLWDSSTGALRRTLRGHSHGVNAVTFSPDGATLASASSDRTLRIWDTATGAHIRTLEGHNAAVYAAVFSPDGETLASAGNDRIVRLWDAATGAGSGTLEGHSRGVLAVAYSPDGATVATAAVDQTVRTWDSSSCAPIRTLYAHGDAVKAVAYSPDGATLASAARDGTVRMWDTATSARARTLPGHGSAVTALAFSPDGATLASAARDGTVRLWDLATSAGARTLQGDGSVVMALAFSPDGATLASAATDGNTRLWHTATVAPSRRSEDQGGWVTAIAFSPDGATLASAGTDGIIRLSDAGPHAAERTFRGRSGGLNALAYSPDGATLASAADDNTVRLWDLASGAPTRTLHGHNSWVRAVAYSPDGETLASTAGETVRLWDPASGVQIRTLKAYDKGHYYGPVNALAYSPDGALLAVAAGQSVRLWDSASRAPTRRLPGHSDLVRAFAFSPDGATLASAADDGTVRLWETSTGASTRTLQGHGDLVRAVAFSSGGATLASAADDGTVRLWETGTGTCVLSVRFGERILALAAHGAALAIALGRAVAVLEASGLEQDACA